MSSVRKIPRVCAACGANRPPTYGIPDPCLGMLPGVSNACCGHGNKQQCYVMTVEDETTVIVRGDTARALQIQLGGSPAPFDRDVVGEGASAGWRRVDLPSVTPSGRGVLLRLLDGKGPGQGMAMATRKLERDGLIEKIVRSIQRGEGAPWRDASYWRLTEDGRIAAEKLKAHYG